MFFCVIDVHIVLSVLGVICSKVFLTLPVTSFDLYITTLTDKISSVNSTAAIAARFSLIQENKQVFGNADGNMEMIYSIHICSEINPCNNSHAIHHFHELTGPFPYFNAEGHSLKSLKAYFLVFAFWNEKNLPFFMVNMCR